MDPITAMYVAQGIHGLCYGMILFLVASGLTLIFGMMGILNLAHASFFMLSAYVSYTVLQVTGNFWLALLVAPAALSSDEQPTSGGRLMWDSGDELDLIADIWADLPHGLSNGRSLFLSLDLRTAIEKAESDFTFALRDVDYALEVGWRRPLTLFGGARLSLFAGQREKVLVDGVGAAHIRYLAAALESPGLRAYNPGMRARSAWRIEQSA